MSQFTGIFGASEPNEKIRYRYWYPCIRVQLRIYRHEARCFRTRWGEKGCLRHWVYCVGKCTIQVATCYCIVLLFGLLTSLIIPPSTDLLDNPCTIASCLVLALWRSSFSAWLTIDTFSRPLFWVRIRVRKMIGTTSRILGQVPRWYQP